jgi:PAS domain S-box-containing protein
MHLTINSTLFNQIFPFGFSLDSDFQIQFAGKSLLKIFPSIEKRPFQKVFSILRPRSVRENFASIAEFSSQIFIIKSNLHQEKLLFRGQMVFVEEHLLFLGTPWLTDANDLKKLHLGLTDFALHDPITDLIQILSVKENAAQDIKMLNQQLEISEKRYRELVELGSDMIFKLDPKGNLLYLNEVAQRITGYQKSQILGKNFSEYIARDWYEFIVETFQKLKLGKQKSYEIETPLLTQSGEKLWIRQHLQLIFEGDHVKEIRVFAKDVTERKKAEDQLIQARQDAEAAQEAEKNFLTHMSHEIRTPLNAIVGMSQLLTQTHPTAEQSQYLDVILSATELLLGLINDVLDLARIQSGQMQVVSAPIDLNQLLENYQRTFQNQLLDKAVSLHIETLPGLGTYLLTDPTIFNQICFNLLGNAVKFTEAGTIHLRCELQREKEKECRIRFSVTDTGIGIAPEKLEAIFDRFHQAHDEVSVQYGGTGLGLAITKNLIELLGGEITVQSEPGKGSTFAFVLPFLDTGIPLEHHPKPGIWKADSQLHGLSVLVAEDNPMNTLYIRKLLEKLGLQPTWVPNGQQAVSKAEQVPFDLILMDIQMPVLDGISATRKIREGKGPNKETPIIALTAATIREKLDQAIASGMNAYLPKPFTPQQMIQKIQEISFEKAISEKILALDEVLTSNLDEDLLLEIYEGDPDYASEMLQSFEQDILPEFYKLQAVIEEGDYQQARTMAHKIKPSFTLVGLPLLQEQMATLTDLTEIQNPEAAPLYRSIREELTAIWPELKKTFAKLTGEP